MEKLMSESVIQNVREKIDDLIDQLENEIDKLPGIPKLIATQAVGVLRGVLQIPDDIGGDED